MSVRGVPRQDETFVAWVGRVNRFMNDVQRGRNRGSGASFGLPFTLGSQWRLEEDEQGNLVVTNLSTGESTILASDTTGDE